MKRLLSAIAILLVTGSTSAWAAFPAQMGCDCGNQAQGRHACAGRIDLWDLYNGLGTGACDCIAGELDGLEYRAAHPQDIFCHTSCPDWGADGGRCLILMTLPLAGGTECVVGCIPPPGVEFPPLTDSFSSDVIESLPATDGPGNNGRGHAYGLDKQEE